jgi:site-specific DNA recombinase
MTTLKAFERFAKGKPESEKRNNTCVIYTRVSTKEQAENNMSLETQRKACEHYSKTHSYKILAFFGGTYESAKTDEREEFNNMLSFVKKSREKISYIIVFSVDRFSRSGANAIYITEQLKHQGISVISVMQPTDASTPSGSLQQSIQFIFSEYDNQLRREKTITGMRNKFLKGEWCMKPPRGYDIVTINGKRSIIVNKEGELIRKAFLWKYYEHLSQTEITCRLATMGLKLRKQSVSNIFRNPFYCGIISVRTLEGKVVNGKHEKLVAQELFLEINNLLSKNYQGSNSHCTDNPDLPLRRFLKCDACNDSFTGYSARHKGLYYYKCIKVGCRCNRNAGKLHSLFSELLNRIRIDEKNHPNLKKEFASNFIKVDKISRKNESLFKGNLTVIKTKIELLEERHVFGEISKLLYKKHRAKLLEEQREVENEMDKLKAGLISKEEMTEAREGIVKNISNLWLNGNLQTKRIIQAAIFPEGIYFEKLTDRLLIKKMAKGFIILD